MSTELSKIIESYPDEGFLLANGFDDCVIGVETLSMRLIYSVSKCVDTLMKQGMAFDDAVEYLEFNTFCAYVGDKTPIWSNDLF